jgi:hypothetical protein
MIGHPPDNITDKSSLAETLRRRRVAAMYSDARLVRAYPDNAERTQEAERLIRRAMYEQALGQITLAERDRIVHVLSFAVEAMRAIPDTEDGECPPT